jgi:uncharacterized protein YyaL (SSP411 family)
LAQESSPYLRQHAHNPVDWYPWGEEALARARRDDKPILLSVGYSACHWCHVMAHESFENADIAERMNRGFICIKVDREERPDVDQLYQGVVQLMGRGGGWPLTVFLTPELHPFFGGTYFPREDRYGMPGFPRVLEALEEAWRTKRTEVIVQAEEFREGLGQFARYGLDGASARVTAEDIIQSTRRLVSSVDLQNGGFGGAPKFPNPMNVALLLRGHRRTGDAKLLEAALLTLRKMAKGGIYDQLGGGFHRYAVDAIWRVPHFEKMLYDNAQLLHLYAEAEQVSPDPLWRKVVEETAAYVLREMTSPEGAFFTAQDADSEGEEGKFFAWTPDQFRAVLPESLAELALRHFGVQEAGTFEHGTSVLEQSVPAEELARERGISPEEARTLLEDARGWLFVARTKRVAPGLDDKVLAGWNGLMVRGLAFAGQVFARPDWVAVAARAADFILVRMKRPDGGLFRVFHHGVAKVDAFVEDYGDLASGLVALYQATFEARYLEAARELAQMAAERFFDPSRNAYLTAPREGAELPVATFALFDNAFPSGASTLTEAQVALAALTGRAELLAQAERYLSRMREEMMENPLAFGHLLLAADSWVDGAPGVVLVGGSEGRVAFLETRRQLYAPTVAWSALDPDGHAPAILTATAEGKTLVGGQPAAYLCRHFKCELPVTAAEALAALLRA